MLSTQRERMIFLNEHTIVSVRLMNEAYTLPYTVYKQLEKENEYLFANDKDRRN